MANGLSDETAIELESFIRVLTRHLEADVAAGVVQPFHLMQWDQWARTTRTILGLTGPGDAGVPSGA